MSNSPGKIITYKADGSEVVEDNPSMDITKFKLRSVMSSEEISKKIREKQS